MSIRIDTLRIAGLRGIKNIETSLSRITVLVGPNNSGKTSLLKAMQLLFGDYSRFVSEEDFNIEEGDKRVVCILVDARIVPVGTDGKRMTTFTEEWTTKFGDKIKAEANLNQFVAVRVRCKPNIIRGGFEVNRMTLERWPDFNVWTTDRVKETKLNQRLENIPFYPIEAQRDIHSELKERGSTIGRVLSNIDYSDGDISVIEDMIQTANKEAVKRSSILIELKGNLERLNQSFQGKGEADITPFPKKLRDLSKHFSVHYGSRNDGIFSMEYHGMGTRSWASLLTLKALVKLMQRRHASEAEPYFPIIAAEEPEAHLHPNAQRTLYHQLAEIDGQIVVSTHSPYLCALADISDIRSLSRNSGSAEVKSLNCHLSREDKKALAREIMSNNAELLFSSSLILCEGVTEEQVIPSMFAQKCGKEMHETGVTCISVSGKNYAPFVKLACSLGIPTLIISDNDGNTAREVHAQLRRLRRETGLVLSEDIFSVEYLSLGNDIEAELLYLGLRDELIDSLVLSETKGSENDRYVFAKYREIRGLIDIDLLIRLRASKASYAGFLGDIIRKNPYGRSKESLIPPTIIRGFTKVESWLTR
jgi:putative ATP-dependent endonuclease of OLD family